MNISQFNHVESGLWFVFSVLLAAQLFKQGFTSRYFRVLLISAITFAVFGISDVIEAKTGAWWRPWWLLLIKISCVLSFSLCFIWYKRINATGPSAAKQPTSNLSI